MSRPNFGLEICLFDINLMASCEIRARRGGGGGEEGGGGERSGYFQMLAQKVLGSVIRESSRWAIVIVNTV